MTSSLKSTDILYSREEVIVTDLGRAVLKILDRSECARSINCGEILEAAKDARVLLEYVRELYRSEGGMR